MNRLITSVIVSLVGFNALLQAGEARPRLVVNIVVDQLRTADLEYLQSLLGQKGFNRMIREGAYLRDVNFKTQSPDIANSTAILMTGASPGSNGIPASQLFDAGNKRMVKVLSDSKYSGINSSDNLSPMNLRFSTISDEIAVNGNGLSLIYSIAADPQQAILLSGHSATGSIWIDPNTGKWASSSFYKSLPQCVTERNFKAPLSSRIDTMVWRPSLDVNRYINTSAAQKQHPFKYTFSSGRDAYTRFAQSPLANREITDLAIDCINTLNLGNRYSSSNGKSAILGEPVDVLNIGYTLSPSLHSGAGDRQMEQQDSYVRLDAQLARLFDAIDRKVGLGNSLVVLSSTGYFDEPPVDSDKFRIPSGEFSARKAGSLLNSYLSARFGNGDYVNYFANGHLYLDHKLIENRGLKLQDVASEARDFLLKMSGINGVYTSRELQNPVSEDALTLKFSNDTRKSGDLIVCYLPGWNVTDDYSYPPQTKTITTAATISPTIIMGGGVVPRTISTTVDATSIAPTVTQILRIRSPNGATGHPLILTEPAQ